MFRLFKKPKFKRGDIVVVTQDIEFRSLIIPKGTKVRITSRDYLSRCYNFETLNNPSIWATYIKEEVLVNE